MAAYAEGFGVLRRASIGKEKTAINAETAPLRDPELFIVPRAAFRPPD